MAQEIVIKNNQDETIGSIRFDETGERLFVRRTATGFCLTIPAGVSLRLVAKDEPVPMVSGLWGYIFATDRGGNTIEVGEFRDERWYSSSYWLSKPGGEANNQANLIWRGSFADLGVYERIREGRVSQFQIQLWGELCYLLSADGSIHRRRSEPLTIYGDASITYPREVWVSRLRSLGVLENILVEIPLTSVKSEPWDEVWRSLIAARNAFEQGGTMGWKSCVTEIRLALEIWHKIEPVSTGPTDPKVRTKQQRLDHLRSSLYFLSNLWVHGSAENCSRDDALLVLSTFSTLLVERNP